MTCSVADCGRDVYARTWCVRHYKRWWKHGDPTGGGTLRGEALQWLLGVISRDDEEGCIIWPYGTSAGYPEVRYEGQPRQGQRLLCIMVHGDPPTPAHQAAHTCGVPLCLNPSHVRWATARQNNADKYTHGTIPLGMDHHGAKLTDADVRAIRARWQDGESTLDLANAFGVSRQNVAHIVARRTWRHLA